MQFPPKAVPVLVLPLRAPSGRLPQCDRGHLAEGTGVPPVHRGGKGVVPPADPPAPPRAGPPTRATAGGTADQARTGTTEEEDPPHHSLQ